MGCCIETTNTGNGEDRGVQRQAGFAVGMDQIDDDALDYALSQSQGAASLRTKVSLRFKCQNLINTDANSKSDPFCVLWQVDQSGRKQKIGMTEMIADNLNPEFVQPVVTNYFFEDQQNMLVEVYDCDDATQLNNLNKQDLVGFAEFPLAKVLSSIKNQIDLELKTVRGTSAGKITIHGEEF